MVFHNKFYNFFLKKFLYTYYDELVSNEAEGVMIRAPKIPYLPKRTKLMLKLKQE